MEQNKEYLVLPRTNGFGMGLFRAAERDEEQEVERIIDVDTGGISIKAQRVLRVLYRAFGRDGNNMNELIGETESL